MKTTRAAFKNSILPKSVKGGEEIDVLVSPLGTFPHPDGEQLCTREAFDALVEKWREDGEPEILVDFDHSSEMGGATEAAAWATALRSDEDGLHATFRMTDKGAEALSATRYRYLSPAWYVDEEGHPTELSTIALTNRPNIPVPRLLNMKAKEINVEDAHGHEHDEDGKFTSKGGGGAGSTAEGSSKKASEAIPDSDFNTPPKSADDAQLKIRKADRSVSKAIFGDEYGITDPANALTDLCREKGVSPSRDQFSKAVKSIDEYNRTSAVAFSSTMGQSGEGAKSLSDLMKSHGEKMRSSAEKAIQAVEDILSGGSNKNATTNNQGNPRMDRLREMLGLAAEATDEEVLAAVDALRAERDQLRSEKEQMEAAAKEAALDAEADKFVEEQGDKIADRDACKNAYKRDPEGTRALFNAIRIPAKPAEPVDGKPARVVDVNSANKPADADLLANCRSGADEIAWAIRNAKHATL